MEARITEALRYGHSLLGIHYVWWLGDIILGADDGPFWAACGSPPPVETIRKQGVCCTGLINLIRRHLGLPVPGVSKEDPHAGGTGAWEEFLLPYLEPIDPSANYPAGTLLFRPYQTFSDQGHVGVILENGQFLHSSVEEPEPKGGFHQPGCHIDKSWKLSHAWRSSGYYMYAVRPEGWLA